LNKKFLKVKELLALTNLSQDRSDPINLDMPNPALNPVRFALWTLRDKAAQRRLALQYVNSEVQRRY